MKNLKKFTKILFTMVIAIVTIFASVLNANAEAETITLGQSYQTGSYIGNFNFAYKVTTDGRYLYCLNYHKLTAENISADMVKGSKLVDGGVVHIIKNGFPTKSITGDKDKDYYITQIAVWWYLDDTHGTSNLSNYVKNTADDPYNLRGTIKSLVEEGKKHSGDSIAVNDTTALKISTSSTEMKLNDNAYVSSDIKASKASNLGSYLVTLTDTPAGTTIVKNGKSFTYTNAFEVGASESFKIQVPASSVSGTSLKIKVLASGKGAKQYTAHEFQPTNTRMQNCALLEEFSGKEVSDSLTLDISSSRVEVSKVDSVTKNKIAGAVLVLKDANGKEITRWTSDINAHIIRNLPNGTYTIIEESAPEGYLVNNKPTTFEITNTKRSISIQIEDAPKKVVVNINKIDSETKQPLAGAVLVVRTKEGKEIARFTTTEESYVLKDLANGTYTVSEESAPAGYIKSDDVIEFTIDEEHLSYQITFSNVKETWVPDTASAEPVLMLVLGIVITGLGIGFIYKNGQKVK